MKEIKIVYLTQTLSGHWKYGTKRMGIIIWERGAYTSEADAKKEAQIIFQNYQLSFRKGN